jgi:hypothetical protein
MASIGTPEGKQFAKILNSLTTQRGMQGSAHYFVCSFSPFGDDLGQWRAYADNGRGFALEFDGPTLEKGFIGRGVPGTEEYAATFPITYNDPLLADLARNITGSMLDLISLPRGKNLNDNALTSYTAQLAISFLVEAAHAGIFFKHPAYRTEQEFRFLETYSVDTPPSVERRARRNSFVEYREFDWKGLAPGGLKRIIVGPATDQVKAAQFATDCLRLYHPEPKSVIIGRSTIPYRAM